MAIDNKVFAAYDFAKNKATSEIKITLDPSKWSKKMENIICEGIETGVTRAGYQTSYFVERLASLYGIGVDKIESDSIPRQQVRPEMWNELISYVCACHKMNRGNPEKDRYSDGWDDYTVQHFMEYVDKGKFATQELPNDEPYLSYYVRNIPLPRGFTASERRELQDKYMLTGDLKDQQLRDELVTKIRTHQPIEILYTID